MYVPFADIPGDARIWIYQADRPFSVTEKPVIEAELLKLCQEWAAHGSPLRTSFQLEYDQFIVLCVDERSAGASGCSIDGSVRLLKHLQQRLGLDFFNRKLAAIMIGSKVQQYPLDQLKDLFESGVISGDAITFNNVLTTKAAWEKEWKVTLQESWLSRYLPKGEGVRQKP